MHTFKHLLILVLTVALAPVSPPQSARANDNEALTIGSKAPALDIEHWFSDGQGKYKPVKKFAEGKVYIVEFWATWCGPCIASMPHISELQNKYAEKGVQVVSVTDEDEETVKTFLERKVRGEKEQTYAELTKNYCLTSDPDQSVYTDYMEASGQNGIPTVFVVGKQGLVEWIGHPMEIDQPLDKIVNDKWDRNEFAVAFKKQQEEERIAMEQELKLRAVLQAGMQQVMEKLHADDKEGAIQVLDNLIAEQEAGDAKLEFQMIRVQMLMDQGSEKGAAAFTEFANENKDEAMLLNQMAWTIVEMKMDGKQVDKSLLAAGINAAELAVAASPNEGAVLDTLGHLLYLNGELDRAIEVQTKAVEYAGDMKDEIEPFLKQWLQEKAEKTANTGEKDKDSGK